MRTRRQEDKKTAQSVTHHGHILYINDIMPSCRRAPGFPDLTCLHPGNRIPLKIAHRIPLYLSPKCPSFGPPHTPQPQASSSATYHSKVGSIYIVYHLFREKKKKKNFCLSIYSSGTAYAYILNIIYLRSQGELCANLAQSAQVYVSHNAMRPPEARGAHPCGGPITGRRYEPMQARARSRRASRFVPGTNVHMQTELIRGHYPNCKRVTDGQLQSADRKCWC
ncbi:hypothetical protein F5X98DRAFT_53540 [Xylaria grammica]|nr:hypothetical protein F5X98DRAFT_53540 [Xylaria grammica]